MKVRHTQFKLFFYLAIALIGLGLGAGAPVLAAATPDAYWTLDDDTFADEMGSGATDGGSNGTVTTVTGQVGNAQQFDPSDGLDNIVIPNNDVIDFAAGASFSIEFWMKHNIASTDDLPLSGVQVIVGRMQTMGVFTSGLWWIGVNADGTAGVDMSDVDGPASSGPLKSTTIVADGGWHHIAVVYDGTVDAEKLMIYVDGALEGTQDHSATTNTENGFDFSNIMTIGTLENTYLYDGAVDNLAIYNSQALTAADVSTSYATGLAGSELGEKVAPTFISSGSATVALGYDADLQALAAGNPLPTYASNDLPFGAELDENTGTITWIPNDGQVGDNAFSIEATNDQGSDTQAWNVTVEDLCTAAIDVYWKLDETDPTAGIDDYTGTAPQGACGTGGCPTSTAGKVGTSFDFSAGNVDVSFPSDEIFDFAAGADFSIELWMNLAAAPGGADPDVLIGRFSATSSWWIGVETTGAPAMYFEDSVANGSVDQIDGTTNLADGDWHHIVVVRDGDEDTLTMYVDGKVEKSEDQSQDSITDDSFETVAPVTLGSFANNFYYAGRIDEVAIYNRALSADMIAQHTTTNGDQYYCNQGPTIAALPTTAVEGVEYSETASATDPEGNAVVTWLLDSAPSGMEIDEDTGEITWTPGEGAATASVVVEAIDEYGATGQLSFTISVTAVDNTPVITGQKPLATPIATPLTIELTDLTVVDADNDYPDDFTLTVQDGANYSVSGTTITPDAGFSGTLTVPVTVNDGNSDSAVFNLEVTVAAGVNARPTISSQAPTTATVGEQYTYDAEASDANNDTLTWSLSGAPGGMAVEASTGIVTWTPSQEGDVSFTLIVSDGNGGEDTESISITVSAGSSDGDGGGGGGGGCFINTTAGASTANGLFVAVAGLLGALGMLRQRF